MPLLYHIQGPLCCHFSRCCHLMGDTASNRIYTHMLCFHGIGAIIRSRVSRIQDKLIILQGFRYLLPFSVNTADSQLMSHIFKVSEPLNLPRKLFAALRSGSFIDKIIFRSANFLFRRIIQVIPVIFREIPDGRRGKAVFIDIFKGSFKPLPAAVQ